MIAVTLYQKLGTSTAVAIYVSITAVISLICVALLKDKSGQLDRL